jgi:hypothetical protein
MPYRCQKCLNTFKTLTLYNKHAAGPAGACNVEKIEVAKPVIAPAGVKPAIPTVTAKREFKGDLGGRSEQKKVKSYKEVNADAKDRADQIIDEALGDDSDHDPEYNPKGEKEDDDDIDMSLKKRKIKIFTPTSSSSTKSYSRITLPREPFPCPKCSKKFETKSKLAEHVDDDHERSCAECEDDFSWPDPSHECYFTKYKLRMLAGDIMPDY